jgi:uncharacterized protein DUF2802
MAWFSHFAIGAAARVGNPARAADVMGFTGLTPMLQFPNIPLDVALLAGRAVFLIFCFVFAAIAFTRWRRASERLAAHFEQVSSSLTARLTQIETALGSLQRRLDDIAERQAGEGRRVTAPASAAPSYQIAIRLARSGAQREELMTSCGLTHQEADLVQRLHAPSRPAKLAAAS